MENNNISLCEDKKLKTVNNQTVRMEGGDGVYL
jgi:hypothetical protein